VACSRAHSRCAAQHSLGVCWRPIVAVVGQRERGRPMGSSIGSLYTRFVSMPQALWAALCEDRQEVIRPEDLQIRTRASGATEVRPRCRGRSSPVRGGGG
jgi:hypothetical protein